MPTDSNAMDTIGSNEYIEVAGIKKVPAKIDTGADSSAIWASRIHITKDGVLHFQLFDQKSPFYTGEDLKRTDYKVAVVRNSSGQEQIRYRTHLNTVINGRKIKVLFFLADRSRNNFPVLIGRRTISGKFLVDVSRKNELIIPKNPTTRKLQQSLKKDPYAFHQKYIKKQAKSQVNIDTPKERSAMKIAILSNGNANYSTRRLVEEAEKRGHDVQVIKYKNCYLSLDDKHPDVYYKGKKLEGFDAILPRIATYMTRYGCAVVRQFEMQNVYTTASSVAITRSRDKLRAAQILAKYDIDTPKTLVSRNTSDIDDLLEQIGLPVIIKLARGTHGNGVILADTRKAAKSALQAFYLYNEDGTNILLQEFIKEAAGTDIRAFVVGNRVIASMQRTSLDDDFRSNLHQGGGAIPIKLTSEEKKIAVKAARVMGLSICGVDMMRSDRGPLVLEVNASPGFGIEKITGCDIASNIIEFIESDVTRRHNRDNIGA